MVYLILPPGPHTEGSLEDFMPNLQFPKQLRASGNKTIILGGSTNYDEFALPLMGDEVIADVSAHVYSAALQTPANEAFVKKYRAKYGKVPSSSRTGSPPAESTGTTTTSSCSIAWLLCSKIE